jgi:hypothetical protein
MKLYKVLVAAFLFAGIFSSVTLSAQDDREDVVYLKDGSIYRGIIVEQIPGVSIKVETLGGNVFNVVIGDIVKITKEKKVAVAAPAPPAPAPRETYGGEGYGHDRFHHYHHYMMGDSNGKPQFHVRKNGYFNTIQLLIENLEGGGRMVNGYRFGRLGYLGIGIGADFIFKDMHGNNDYSGVYLPLYLHYGGDILKKRITPFYSIEAGYAMRMKPNGGGNFFPGDAFNNNSNITDRKGGLMGGVGFGVKFYSRHKVFFSISAHADFQQAENKYTQYLYDPAGNYYATSYKTHATLMIPGVRLGLGF